MKKFLSKFSLCLMVAIFGVTLFACGGGKPVDQDYKQVAALVQEIEEKNNENHMFVSSEVPISTDYALTYYNGKVKYDYYNELFVVPMNFIQTYYVDLNRLENLDSITSDKQEAINQLVIATSSLRANYYNSVDRYNMLDAFITSPVITEGNLQVFNQSLKGLFNSAYDVALKLANVKDKVFNDYACLKETKAPVTSEQVVQLRDYFVLQQANDYNNIFVNNMRMEDFSDKTGTAAVNTFAMYVGGIKNNLKDCLALQALTAEQLCDLTGDAKLEPNTSEVLGYDNKKVKDLFDLYQIMQNEKMMLTKSMQEFDMYDFYVKYSCNINAYTNQYSPKYWEEILNFYVNYSKNYTEYLTNIFKKLGA